jgi:hypothetical protein
MDHIQLIVLGGLRNVDPGPMPKSLVQFMLIFLLRIKCLLV